VNENKIKVGIIGTRGIPNNYGGFERFVELLVEQHNQKSNLHFTIFGEKNQQVEYNNSNYDYVILKSRKSQGMIYYIESIFKSLIKCDVIFCCGVSISFLSFMPRIFGKKLIINPDGCEWERERWSKFQRFLIRTMYFPALLFANKIIVDSESLKSDFGKFFTKKYVYIPYQHPSISFANDKDVKRLFNSKNIKLNDDYILVIARLEPENNLKVICDAFIESKSKKQLIIVGKTDTVFYLRKLERYNNPTYNIFFTDGIYNQDILNSLRKNALLYIHGHSVGGTNPSLIEALASCLGNIACHNNKYNMEVAKDFASYFSEKKQLIKIIHNTDQSFLKDINNWYDPRFNPQKIYQDYMSEFKKISLK